MRILAFVDYYLPGYKGGGPAVSVSRLIASLSGHVEFAVFTRDRDLGDSHPYTSVTAGEWSENQGVRVFYARPEQITQSSILDAIKTCEPDAIYLNSYFSKLTRTVLTLRLKNRLPGIAIILAPRGEFSPGALKLKAAKKRAYLWLAGLLRFHRGITWQVSSEHELRHTRNAADADPHHFLKPPDIFISPAIATRSSKSPGGASFAFISRIGPKKNLLGAILMLRAVRGDVTYTVYGPIEDEAYWSECERLIADLPQNVRVEYGGPIPSKDVVATLGRHHFFLFPTLGENFGHVIPEALNAGCPVLLSDQTPWLDLEDHNAGWVTSLDDLDTWELTIQNCLDMDREAYERMSADARAYVERVAHATTDPLTAKRMFEVAIQYQRKAA